MSVEAGDPAANPVSAGARVAELARLEHVLRVRLDDPESRVPPPPPPAPRETTLEWLAARFRLDPLEQDLIQLALLPELDARYQRLFAEIQGSPLRRRPSAGLALELLTSDAATRLAARSRLAADGTLVRWGIVRFEPDPVPGCDGSESRMLRLDPGVVEDFLGTGALDPEVTRIAQYLTTAAANPELPAALGEWIRAFEQGESVAPSHWRLAFVGREGIGRTRATARLGAALGVPAFRIDVPLLFERNGDSAVRLRACLREAYAQRALLCLAGLDAALEGEWWRATRGLEAEIASWPAPIVILAAPHALERMRGFADAQPITFALADAGRRSTLWAYYAGRHALPLDDGAIARLGTRFKLTRREIEQTVTQVAAIRRRAQVVAEDSTAANRGANGLEREIFAVARARHGAALERLATRVHPMNRWADLVLPEEPRSQLRELVERVARAPVIEEAWGFARHLPRTRGVSVLFSGASGTGKTMAAEIIAGEIGLDLFRIDLASIVSKYIGETEKNLDHLFEAAEGSNGVLFFDEADAIFGKRSEVRDSHDRYANQEISYLLQRMESYEGVAILATNLQDHLDEAFRRRLTLSIHFPLPDATHRLEMWRRIWPASAPLDPALDLESLAQAFDVTGGSIRNIALGAAYLAAANGGTIRREHVFHAARREYQKLERDPGGIVA